MPITPTESFRGAVTEGVLCPLMGRLYRSTSTGILRLTGVELSGGAPRVTVRELTLGGGALVGMTSNVDEEALPPVLLRRGVLTPADLWSAGVRAREGRQPLEWVLDDLGLLGPARRREALLHSAIEALLHVFAWTDGAYTFEERLADSHAAEVPLAEVLGEVANRLGARELERALGDLERPLGKGASPLARDADALEASLLASSERGTSARQALSVAPVARPEAERRLLYLLCTGALVYGESEVPLSAPGAAATASRPPRETAPEPSPAPRPAPRARPSPPAVQKAPAARPAASVQPAPPAKPSPPPPEARRQLILTAHRALPGATPFEVLGVSRNATEAEIKSAYVHLARTFHPDAQGEEGLADLRDPLTTLLVAVGEAYQVLKDPRRRAAYEAAHPTALPVPPPPSAASADGQAPGGADPLEECVLRAHAALNRKEVGEAIHILESLLTISGAGKDVRRSSLVLLARAYRSTPNRTRDAERILLELVGEDPRYIPGYVALGNLYKEEGMRSRALRMFRKVLELDPQHRQALEEALGVE